MIETYANGRHDVTAVGEPGGARDSGAPVDHRRSPAASRHLRIVILIVAVDVLAGTAYIIGYLLEQHFMLVIGMFHIGLGALHYVEHATGTSPKDTGSGHRTG